MKRKFVKPEISDYSVATANGQDELNWQCSNGSLPQQTGGRCDAGQIPQFSLQNCTGGGAPVFLNECTYGAGVVGSVCRSGSGVG